MSDKGMLHDVGGQARQPDDPPGVEPSAASHATETDPPAGTTRATTPPPFAQPEPVIPPAESPPPGDVSARTPNRPGRIVAIVALLLALILGAGVVGGWAATVWNDNSAGTTTGAVQTVPKSGEVSQETFATIVSQVQPSVVSIKTSAGEGSGVVLDTDGDILTNNHVAASATGSTVTVTFSDGTSAQASIVGTDPRSDLAVVKVDGGPKLSPVTFADSDQVQVGDTVLALGSPLGLEGSVTSGIISAKNRTIQESGQQRPQGAAATSIAGLLQTDAAINPGNSGGALVDMTGQVVGINTAIATTGQNSGNIGVGFAIPSNTAKSVAEQLINGQQVAHPYLGVAVADTADGAGVLVQSVEPSGPAAKAGLQAGDVITAVNGQAIHNADDLISAVQGSDVGQQLPITYTRAGAEQTATATLAEAQ